MATARTGLTLKPVVQNLRSLYRRPPTTISGIDNDTWYSPNQPVEPFAAPESGVAPRAFQTWSGQNQIFTPRSDAEYTAADLKSLATYPLARICIENVKDTVCRAPWEIQAKPRPGETRKDVISRSKGDELIVNLNRFFEYPDRENNWQEWLSLVLDDLLVIDAVSVMIESTFKGDIVGLPTTRGEMITRYIDGRGFTPRPPSPAYAQNWWGLPLVNMTTDQLVYKPRRIVPRNTLASQLYGMSPTEQLGPELQIGIKRMEFVLSYYTEGSVPGVVHVVPRGTNPDRIIEAMQWMNSELAGNLTKRNQWRMIQGFNEPGKPDQIEFTKEPLLAGLYDEKHIREVAFGYGTSPQRLMKMIRTEGDASSDSAEVQGTLPWVLYVKGLIDYIIQRKLGYSDYEIAINPYAEPDPLKNAAALTMLVGKALLSPNEGRKRIGEELKPEPEADRLGVITGTGFVPIGVAAAVAGVKTDEDGNVKPHPVKPTQPPVPPTKDGKGGGNASRGGTPVSQEAGSGRSKGKNNGTPNGKESLDSKKKLLKRLKARIEAHVLSPESQAAVHHIHAAVKRVFEKQSGEAHRVVAAHFHKAFAKRKFGSVQFNLAPDDAQRVIEIPVDPADIGEKGRDLGPHVTVRWGFHPEVTAEQVNAITKGTGSIDVTLGALETFAEGPDGVPLIIRFESERLQELHAALGALPNTATHPDYKPHICVAYLKPEADASVYTSKAHALEGETITLSHLVLSGIDRSMTDLEKKAKLSHKDVEFEHPAKGPHHCSQCEHYAGENKCELVKSPIAPEDWCNKFEAIAKVDKAAKDDAADLSRAIVDAIESEWLKLPPEVRPQLQTSRLSGVGAGLLQLEVHTPKLLASANQAAADFASERAAELVGKKYNEDGELVDNPNAEWAISDTTRDKIREIITNSFKDESSIRDVKDEIQAALEDEAGENGIFSDARAMMIARTEISRAQAAGNFSVWDESGIVKSLRWISSEDEKVCEVCDGNDQIVVNIGEPFPSGDQYPGAHPACRCAVIVEATR